MLMKSTIRGWAYSPAMHNPNYPRTHLHAGMTPREEKVQLHSSRVELAPQVCTAGVSAFVCIAEHGADT
jgi:hypothetical protein